MLHHTRPKHYCASMTKQFSYDILRANAPTRPSFTISEIPYRAKLDQNESPLDVPDEVKHAIASELLRSSWNRYPQPKSYAAVKEQFAAAIGADPDTIVLTAGCDQMILLAFLSAGGSGRTARIFEPAYPMFAAYAAMTQTELDRVVLGPEFDIRANGLGPPVNLLILVSPNNPTGNGPDRALIEQALERNCLVFVDEAYGDYAGQTVIDLVDDYPNLLVARSLSKSLLAGVRLGFGVGHPDLINVLEQLIFAPYHLNMLQLTIAKNFGLIIPHLEAMVRNTRTERARIISALEEMGQRVWPSKGNFVMFATSHGKQTYDKLLAQGVRIRDISSMPGMTKQLRVTVGTREENDWFLQAMATSL